MMRVKLDDKNVEEFLNCISDFINQELNVELRDFVISLNVNDLNSAYIYTDEWGLQPYTCSKFDCELHVHHELSNCYVFCTRLEVLALLFLKHSLYHNDYNAIIKSLQEWLPAATAQVIDVSLNDFSKNKIVKSYLDPSYVYRLLHSNINFVELTYIYITDNIEYTNFCVSENNNKIMVRTRSRSRSRSPGRPRRRRASRTRNRSRSRSPRRTRTTMSAQPYRRRSRSRSTSRRRT